jgi:hypothetical protein
MATHPEGETNEAKLVPAVLPQVRAQVTGPRLWALALSEALSA